MASQPQPTLYRQFFLSYQLVNDKMNHHQLDKMVGEKWKELKKGNFPENVYKEMDDHKIIINKRKNRLDYFWVNIFFIQTYNKQHFEQFYVNTEITDIFSLAKYSQRGKENKL